MANLGYDEIVDTALDVIGVYKKFSEALSDGIQIQDAFVILNQAPVLQEVYEDRKVFVEEFLDLTPSESEAAVQEIAQKVGMSEDQVLKAIVQGFALAAQWHKQVQSTITLVEETRDFGTRIFRGQQAA